MLFKSLANLNGASHIWCGASSHACRTPSDFSPTVPHRPPLYDIVGHSRVNPRYAIYYGKQSGLGYNCLQVRDSCVDNPFWGPNACTGTRFAMGYQPFWSPAAYIPILGMLCGNTISAIVVSTTSVLRDVKYV